MPYIKIIGDDEHYNDSIDSFVTQHGYQGIRFIGDEIPETDQGFMMYDDNDEVMADLSRFKYIYKPNEYSEHSDEIEAPLGSYEQLPPSPYDMIYRNISRLDGEINELTPYEFSQEAYIEDTECIFDNVPNGKINIKVIGEDGNYISYTIEKTDSSVIVKFDEPLEQVASVILNVDKEALK